MCRTFTGPSPLKKSRTISPSWDSPATAERGILHVLSDGARTALEWPANAIVRDRYALRIEPRLQGGGHKVVLGLVRDGQSVGERVEVGKVVMLAPERNFTAPLMAQMVGATFDGVLRLLGYDLEMGTGALHVTLHWQTLRRMETSYKFFVHLDDAESGELVAQADVMPHDWGYPTSWWETGEVVSDEIALSLGDVPPGRYRLWVGVYHPDTGERLPISGVPSGLIAEGGRLALREGIVR